MISILSDEEKQRVYDAFLAYKDDEKKSSVCGSYMNKKFLLYNKKKTQIMNIRIFLEKKDATKKVIEDGVEKIVPLMYEAFDKDEIDVSYLNRYKN
jgi:hypothetical protein